MTSTSIYQRNSFKTLSAPVSRYFTALVTDRRISWGTQMAQDFSAILYTITVNRQSVLIIKPSSKPGLLNRCENLAIFATKSCLMSFVIICRRLHWSTPLLSSVKHQSGKYDVFIGRWFSRLVAMFCMQFFTFACEWRC